MFYSLFPHNTFSLLIRIKERFLSFAVSYSGDEVNRRISLKAAAQIHI